MRVVRDGRPCDVGVPELVPGDLVLLAGVVRAVALMALAAGSLLGVAALALGLDLTQAFLFGVGVPVALVPEGLLPTVTLSLARGAQVMAGRKALVRWLDAVETLGATTFICTDAKHVTGRRFRT